jgi:hypothetical protein
VETDSFAGDLGRVDQVLENLFVNFFQSTGSWALLLLSGTTGRLTHHSSLTNEDYMTIGELLFEFTGQSKSQKKGKPWIKLLSSLRGALIYRP